MNKLMKVRGREKESMKRKRKMGEKEKKKGMSNLHEEPITTQRRPGDGCYGNRGTDAGDDGGVVMSQAKQT